MGVSSTLQPASPDNIAMAPLTPTGTASRVPSANGQGEEGHENGQRSDSVSFIKSEGLKTATVVTVAQMHKRSRKNSQAPTLAGDHRGIYWPTPAKMISFFSLGLVCCAAHHVYYSKRNGGQVLSQVDQQWALRAGTTFAFLVSTSLVASVHNAYTQWLWKTLKNKEMSIEALDAAFQADLSAHAIVNREMFWKMPVGSLVAIIALSIPIASLITPTTLSVRQGEYYYNTTANVTSLDMSTVDSSGDINQPSLFAVYVPLNGQNSSDNTSEVFTGPRTIISRFSNGAASIGDILPIIPSYLNSTYILQFYGPKVECTDAGPFETGIIENLIKSQMVMSEATERNQEIDYFAFVPAKNSSVIYPILGNRPEEPVDAMNQLWMAYSKYGNGSNCQNPSNITWEYTVCSLWNVSYAVNFTFENGIQNITAVDQQLLEEVDYPTVNASSPSNLTQLAYSAYMWAFTDQIIGFMEIYEEILSNGSAGTNNSQIQTQIQNTALLGSSDLDVFFDQRRVRLDGAPNCTLSDQRAQDIGLARNYSLHTLIPELSFNITMSYFSSSLLSPLVETNVTTKSIVNFYYYNRRDLWISYGLALGFALLANILGGVAFWINRVAHDRSFSALLSSTRDAKLARIFNPETLGKLPLQGDVAKTPLKFEVMGKEGGLGLTLIETKPAGDEPAENEPAENEPAEDEPAEGDPVAVDSDDPRTN